MPVEGVPVEPVSIEAVVPEVAAVPESTGAPRITAREAATTVAEAATASETSAAVSATLGRQCGATQDAER